MTTDDCQSTLKQIYGFIDGEINDDQREIIRHHLDDCPPCDHAYDFAADLRRIVAKSSVETCPETLRLRIAVALELDEGSG